MQEHSTSPSYSSMLSPWEIPNPFEDVQPFETTSHIPPVEIADLDPGKPRWLRVRVSMPHIVHRDLDVAGRAEATRLHPPALSASASRSRVVPVPTMRRVRSAQQPYKSSDSQHDHERQPGVWPKVRRIDSILHCRSTDDV